jgi:CHAD domain-containing protein
VSDLLAPDELTLQAAGEALEGRLDVARGAVREIDRSYYDTFDGLLHGDGMVAVYEDGRLALVDLLSGEERASAELPEPHRPLLAFSLAPGPLRDALIATVDVRALLPLVRIHSARRSFAVLDEEQKTVVRLTLEESAVVSPTGRRTPLRPRLRLAAVRGYDEEFDRAQREVQQSLGFIEADEPLVDEAVRARGGTPGGTSSKIELALDPEQRSDEAAAAVLRRLLEVMNATLPGTIEDIDSEFLHDFRVAVRRSRSVQREFRHVFAPAPLERMRAEFRWLQQVTGDSRDLDVYVLEFDQYRAMVPEGMRASLEPLLTVLRRRRGAAHREMVDALRSERAVRLLADWSAFLDELVGLPEYGRPDAPVPVGELAAHRIRRVYKQMLRIGGAIDSASPPEDYHELRKKGKELRYLLELFGVPLFSAEVVKPMIKALKALQDVLGRHQDREVQLATVHSLRDDVARMVGGADALMAMGVLVERLGEDERAARQAFAERFEAFSSQEQHRLVKETFK